MGGTGGAGGRGDAGQTEDAGPGEDLVPEGDAAPPDAPGALDSTLEALPAADTAPADAPPIDAAPAPDTQVDSPPELPFVSISHAPGVASTDLTAEGTHDWRHWGYNASSAANRKRNGPGIIRMEAIGSGEIGRYIDRPVRFSWNDGWPTSSAAETPDGIVVGDREGRGFEVEVTGSPTVTRRIKAHLGVWGARARLTVTLSDRAGTVYADNSLVAGEPGADRIYSILFQPSVQTQKLVLRWTVENINQTYGNVTLQAVSVAE